MLGRWARKLRGTDTRQETPAEDECPDPAMSELERMDDEDELDGRPTQ